jgi:probable phosphoglycerate mutase
MARRILYLVRHGQYTSTTPHPEEPDGALTDIGRQQAELVGRRLSQIPINKIHYSTLQRTRETAEIIAGQIPGVPVQPSDLLRECIPSVPEEFKEHFTGIPADFIERSKTQAEQAFDTFFKSGDGNDDQHEILVSHGNLIGYLVCRVLKAPIDSWILADIYLGSFSQVLVGPNGFMKIIRHNDSGHLPPELLP